jgi:hypothetical protein
VNCEARLGDLIDDLVHTDRQKVGEHDFDDGPKAFHCRTQRQPDDGRLTDRRIFHPAVAEGLQQSARPAKRAPRRADVLADDEDLFVPRHLFVQRFVDCLDVSNFLHDKRTPRENRQA